MKNIFKDKVVLITGHTGFKGGWLSIWLAQLGAKVVGISIDIPTTPSIFKDLTLSDHLIDYRVDICDSNSVKEVFTKHQPDFVFHMAAQSLVRQSYDEPLGTFFTNALGSVSVLDALRDLKKPVVAVMITSDKAYDNVEWVWGYRESDRLGGKDPYSASKGMAELAIRSYFESFFRSSNSNIKIGIARAGNVIGGGDWATDRIVPDCIRAWSNNESVNIRKPDATRPWQHVLEPLSGYLSLSIALHNGRVKSGEAYNFGPHAHNNYSVFELINTMSNFWENVKWNDISKLEDHVHEAVLLKLNCDKALSDLKWEPALNFNETIKMTVEWYKKFYQDKPGSIYKYTSRQIKEYTNIAKSRRILWADDD
jgi:CDP-glucose 4,6-dehydratase